MCCVLIHQHQGAISGFGNNISVQKLRYGAAQGMRRIWRPLFGADYGERFLRCPVIEGAESPSPEFAAIRNQSGDNPVSSNQGRTVETLRVSSRYGRSGFHSIQICPS